MPCMPALKQSPNQVILNGCITVWTVALRFGRLHYGLDSCVTVWTVALRFRALRLRYVYGTVAVRYRYGTVQTGYGSVFLLHIDLRGVFVAQVVPRVENLTGRHIL